MKENERTQGRLDCDAQCAEVLYSIWLPWTWNTVVICSRIRPRSWEWDVIGTVQT